MELVLTELLDQDLMDSPSRMLSSMISTSTMPLLLEIVLIASTQLLQILVPEPIDFGKWNTTTLLEESGINYHSEESSGTVMVPPVVKDQIL